jgi:hypothetical protein
VEIGTAKLAENLRQLDTYPYSGHSALIFARAVGQSGGAVEHMAKKAME